MFDFQFRKFVDKEKPKVDCKDILGTHPTKHLFGTCLSAIDGCTQSGIPHRALNENSAQRDTIVAYMRKLLVLHHASSEAIARDKKYYEAILRQGLQNDNKRMKRFPTNLSTQKGNLAEIILADYIAASAHVELPVYRLRYDPNINQSMKGDDVLAFDLDSEPMRVIVGESKFRSVSSKTAVLEIIESLERSYKGGVPISLQFIADRLFEEGNEALGNKILKCAILFTNGNLEFEYIGMLMSDINSANKLNKHARCAFNRVAVLSLNIETPDSIIKPCYDNLENFDDSLFRKS